MRDGLDADEVAARSMGWDHYIYRNIFNAPGDNPFHSAKLRAAWLEGWDNAKAALAVNQDQRVLEDYRVPRETKKDD